MVNYHYHGKNRVINWYFLFLVISRYNVRVIFGTSKVGRKKLFGEIRVGYIYVYRRGVVGGEVGSGSDIVVVIRLS